MAGVLLLAVAGCRTTEENYRNSYDLAVGGTAERDSLGVDKATYNKIIEQNTPKATAVGADSVPMVSGYAWQFYGQENPLCKYNVVVGAMKQQFNAKAFCDRLKGAGCKAYVITDREKNYYVVAAGFNSVENAAAYLRDIHRHISFKLPLSEPYIYDTARIYVKP